MKILALDFSSPQRSVAVLAGAGAPGVEVMDSSTGRDMKPFALIESALHQAGLEREAIECLAIGIGPGSYTGIRVALALAQGWQLATGVKLLGISSVAVVAAQAVATGVSGRFNVVVDAQRGEFYLAGYEVVGGALQETTSLQLATATAVAAHSKSGELVIGPEVNRWFPEGRIIFPQASALSRLALTRTDFLPGEKLEPIYLRETTFVKAPPARRLPFAL